MKAMSLTLPAVVSTAACAAKPNTGNSGPEPGTWAFTGYFASGELVKLGPFASKEDCEKVLPSLEREQHTTNSQCVPTAQ